MKIKKNSMNPNIQSYQTEKAATKNQTDQFSALMKKSTKPMFNFGKQNHKFYIRNPCFNKFKKKRQMTFTILLCETFNFRFKK